MEKRITSIKEHQEILYDLLYTLDDFCKKYNIRYFLAHGTLLGAVRHNGIIPWDDDADVQMERGEYERFKELITTNPPKGYKGYHIDNTKGYYYPFMKFGKIGTRVIERDWKCVPAEGIGINIDIFPIDGCPNDKVEAEKYVVEEMNKIFNNIHYWRNSEWKNFKGIKKKFFYILYWVRKRPIFLKPYLKRLYSETQQYKLKESEYYFSFWSFCGAKVMNSTKEIENLTYIKFGTRMLPIPIGYDAILRKQYGDYMTPPPVEEQGSTHLQELYVEV